MQRALQKAVYKDRRNTERGNSNTKWYNEVTVADRAEDKSRYVNNELCDERRSRPRYVDPDQLAEVARKNVYCSQEIPPVRL